MEQDFTNSTSSSTETSLSSASSREQNLVRAGRIILSVLFIFSGLSKLMSLSFFDGLVGELFFGADFYDHYTGMTYVQILTRVIISGELLLGAALLQEKHFKKIVLPFTFILLAVFTIHLFYEGFRQDNFVTGNCGCFGEILPMTILQSIIKNVLSMVIVGLVWWRYKPKEEIRLYSWVFPTVLGAVCLGTVWFTIKDYTPANLNNGAVSTAFELASDDSNSNGSTVDTNAALPLDTVNSVDTTNNNDTGDGNTVPLEGVSKGDKPEKTAGDSGNSNDRSEDPKKRNPKDAGSNGTAQTDKLTPTDVTINLLKSYGKFSDGSNLEVGKGTQLVCIFSMTCSHCQEVYKDMCELDKYGKFPPKYLFNYGEVGEQKYFFNQAGGCEDRHIRFGHDNYVDFMRVLEGTSFPRMLVFKDGEIVKQWDVDTYSRDSMKSFFNIEEKEEGGGLFDDDDDKKDPLDDEGGKLPWE